MYESPELALKVSTEELCSFRKVNVKIDLERGTLLLHHSFQAIGINITSVCFCCGNER